MATDATTVSIPERDTSALSQLVSRTGIAVDSLSVSSEEEYGAAGDLLKLVAERRNAAYEYLSGDIDLAHKLHKSLTTKRADLVKPWDLFRSKIESVMKTFRLSQQKALDAQRREQEDRERKLKEAADKEAAKLKAQGNFTAARQIVAEAETVVAHSQQLIPEVEKVKGVRESEVWSGVCEDPMALLKAVVAGRIPLMHTVKVAGKEREEPLFTVNQRVLDMMADRLHMDLAWPGVTVKKDLQFGVSKGG
jgi:hypothetical protein